MKRNVLITALVALTAAAGLSPASAGESGHPLASAPPGEPYAPVSELVPLPDFLPGLGQLYVDPATLPAGPFLGYDRDGKLAETTYMIPLDEFDADIEYSELGASGRKVTSVDIRYNAGHPGVEEPHVHITLWHGEAARSRVAE